MSKLGDFDSYGADPRRIEKAGDSFSGVKVDYASKYKSALNVVNANYESLKVPYYGLDNDDYVNGLGFCCKPTTPTNATSATTATTSPTGKTAANKTDNAELQQYYYHPDHLGSSSYISNLDGEVVQHVEYVPFGEVFLEEKNAVWNTPYLFNGKELDKETGMSYYGARYYEPKTSVWLSVDSEFEKYINWTPYNYCKQSPISRYDPDGNDDIFSSSGRYLGSNNSGNSVKIQIGNKQYSPSQLNTSIGSRNAMARIGAYYAGKIGVDAGTKITTGSLIKDKEYIGSNETAAYTTKLVISLNVNGGFSKALDHIGNFKNILKHENLHKEDNENPNFKSSLLTHADVYLGQMNDKTFDGTTKDFKNGMAGSFANYLLNIDKSPDFNPRDFETRLDSFNSINKNLMELKRQGDDFGNHPKGSLNLELKFKGKSYDAIYKKINE